MAPSKRKLVPTNIEFEIMEGIIALRNGYLCLEVEGESQTSVSISGDWEQGAMVLLELAKQVLNRLDPTVAQEILHESGLAPKEVVPKEVSPKEAPNVSNVSNVCMNVCMDERKESKETDAEQTKNKLLTGGVPADQVRYLFCLSGIRGAILKSTNPVQAAKTILSREKHQRSFPAWLKKHPAEAVEPQADVPPAALPDAYADLGAQEDAEDEVEIASGAAFEVVED